MDEALIKPIEKKNEATKLTRVRFTIMASLHFWRGPPCVWEASFFSIRKQAFIGSFCDPRPLRDQARPCVYRKFKSARNRNEVRQGSGAIWCFRSAELGERPAHLCSMTGAWRGTNPPARSIVLLIPEVRQPGFPWAARGLRSVHVYASPQTRWRP